MKKFLSLILLSSFVFSAVSPVIHAEIPTENVIIIFKDDVDHTAVKSVNGKIEEVLDNVPVVTGEIPSASLALLEKDQDVLAVEIDQRVKISGQVQDWGIRSVNAPASWESQFTGKGMKIAVLDTGISPHEDLLIAGGVSLTSYTSSFNDDNGHGTHVAGIIGAKNNSIGTVGVAHEADVFAVKVLDKNGDGYLSDILKGIDWSISNNMDIINLSLGAPSDSLALRHAVDKAYNSGILVVAAAGNDGTADGTGDTVYYPARYDSVIAVSATDTKNKRGSFSATGNTVEFAAPGVNIVSTYLNNKYVSMNGTSMAAPYVAGTLALLKQANPALSNIQLRDKLKETAVDIGEAGKDPFFGYGLVQAPIKAQETKSVTEESQTQPVQWPSPAQQPAIETAVVQNPAPVQQPAPKPTQQPAKAPVKIEPAKPVVKPAPLKNMTATVKTARSAYKAGSTVFINVKAIDKSSKKALANSIVKVTVTPPKGKPTVVSVKTNSKGEAIVKMATSKRSVKGTYKISITATATGYTAANTSKTIRIN